MSFNYVMSYFDKLVDFMTCINSNVNWNNILNELMNQPIEKIFKRIKTYLWTDKTIESELDPITKNTFMYYTKLLYGLYDELFNEKCCVVVMDQPMNNDNMIDNEFIANKMKIKFNVLTELLNFKMINYKVLNYQTKDEIESYVKDYNKIILFPTCSILYKEPNKLIDTFKDVILVDDGYYNIYSSQAEAEFNLFRLLVIELFNDPTIDINELLTKKYGMLYVGVNTSINSNNHNVNDNDN